MARDSSRRNNRRGRGSGRSRSRSKSTSRKSSASANEEKTKKTLNDHICYVGSAKNARDCVTNTNFTLNYIKLTFAEGLDIAQALKEGKEFDFDPIKPTLQASAKSQTTEKAEHCVETEQFKLEFTTKFEAHNNGVDQCRHNKASAAALLWKQCLSGMRAKLQARTDFEKIEKDPIKLLQATQQHSMNYENT